MSEPETRVEVECVSFRPGDVIPAAASLRSLAHKDWHSLEEADRVAVKRAGGTSANQAQSKESLRVRMSFGYGLTTARAASLCTVTTHHWSGA